MPVGPLRRSIGALGLIGLAPVAAMVAKGTLHPVDAAWRAVILLVGLLALGRVANWGMGQVASALERANAAAEEEARAAEEQVSEGAPTA